MKAGPVRMWTVGGGGTFYLSLKTLHSLYIIIAFRYSVSFLRYCTSILDTRYKFEIPKARNFFIMSEMRNCTYNQDQLNRVGVKMLAYCSFII